MKIKTFTQNSIVRVVLITTTILIIPLLLGWPWTRSDFIVAGTILLIAGMMLNLVIIKVNKYKIPAVLVIIFLFVWLWVELAVGLFTNWGS